jgi:hypothetical protein
MLGRAYHVSYDDLNERFNKMAFRINSLLAAEAPIKLLVPKQPVKISLTAGSKCHYKVEMKDQTIPLKIKVTTYRGVHYAYLSISQTIDRPNRMNNDKVISIANKESCLTYHSDNPRAKFFNIAWIYVTLECDKEINAMLFIEFGSNKKIIEHNTEEQVQAQSIEQEEVKPIKKEQRMFQVKVPVPLKLTRRNFNSINKHRKVVLMLRDKREEEDKVYKMVLINKRKIGEWYDVILDEKLKNACKFKTMLVSWINLIKTFKIALMLNEGMVMRVGKKRMMEHKRKNGMKIKRAIKKFFTSNFGTFKEQLHSKLNG